MNPVDEARRRGEILLIIRMGNIDLDAKGTPPLDAPTPFGGPLMPRAVPMPTPPSPGGPTASLPSEPFPGGPLPKTMPTKLP